MIHKPVIAVTGSCGKTMVKTMIAAILRERWVVFESNDYYNIVEKTKEHLNQIGDIHRAVVLEYGMAFPGAITEHCNIICPDMSVITNVGLVHIGNFKDDIKLLAMAKSEIIQGMNPGGVLFLNSDDVNSALLDTKDFMGKIIYIGSDYSASDIYTYEGDNEYGIKFKVKLHNDFYDFYIPVLGRHNVYNALFAIAVTDHLGFTPFEINAGLYKMSKPNHRLNVIRLREGIKVIDDTVHSHPQAVKAAIDVLSELSGKKKIAVLGTMPELGLYSKEYHEDIGRYVHSHKIDYLYTYGGYSVNIGNGAIDSGFPKECVNHKKVALRKIMHDDLVNLIEPNTTVLVKGASRLDMYETVKFLCDYFK